MKKLIFAIIMVLAITTGAFAAKTCMHYKKAIVCEGDNKYKVLDKCGEPMSQKTVGEIRTRSGWFDAEEWVYKYHGKLFVLKIVGDKVYSITKVE